MIQMILPGMDKYIQENFELRETQLLLELLQAYLQLQTMMKTYPKLLPRAGIVGEKVIELIQATDNYLQSQLQK